MDYSFEQLAKRVDCLPTLKSVAARAVQLCSDPKTPISTFVDVVSSDQSISSQILKLANSSYFAHPRKITTIDKAIMVLGIDIVRDVVLSIAIFSLYHTLDDQSDFDLHEFWEHAYLTASVGKALADKYDPEKKELLFIAGLFHDVGKLVQHQIIQKDFLLLFIKSQREDVSLHVIERKILGFHHGDVGAVLLQNWNLPNILVKMVKYHHYPLEFIGSADESRMVKFCYLSNLLTHFIQNGLQNFEDLSKLDKQITACFNFDGSEFDKILGFIKRYVTNHKSFNQILMES